MNRPEKLLNDAQRRELIADTRAAIFGLIAQLEALEHTITADSLLVRQLRRATGTLTEAAGTIADTSNKRYIPASKGAMNRAEDSVKQLTANRQYGELFTSIALQAKVLNRRFKTIDAVRR